ncbi:GNAT family N-acetyltransferase [Acinetobacter sp.]|uniref:GNAT family N-acetyltransferase n=1 Tax=Acinetobacter sp. TaxID=472 RepID=UPI002649657E|nr:GNAT family N-acetyltransferase [Acinetobacter sp.]MDN5512990.1 GNAT family N-acetyltransferase [Acinetobacter sp.]MDN5525108.1 GNAT family N-acetyltransferase [Acinetobacter sp.]
MQPLNYRLAQMSDIENLVCLINQAYRTDSGNSWTSEQNIVAGDRINQQQLLQSLKQENFYLFIAEATEDFQTHLVACIGLTCQADHVEIGTFCVDSHWQNKGIGKQLLRYAEKKALEIFPALRHYEMYVLDARAELIQYYERCGYAQTDYREAYPLDANVGQPLIDLQLQHMRKLVLQNGSIVES